MDREQVVSPRPRWLYFGLYGLITLLYWMSLYLYVPTLPTYAERTSETLALVGTVLAQYGLWQAIVRLPLGVAADWIGQRKPFILIGLGLSGLGAYLMGTASTSGGLAVGRAITGLAAGTWVPLTVVFSSLFPADEAVRATSILTVVASVGRVIATTLTGSLNELGGYSLAFFAAAVVAGLAVVVLLPVPETKRPAQQPSMTGTGHLIARRDVLLPSLLSAVSQYAVWAVPLGFLPILAAQLGANDVHQSMLVSLHIGMVTLGGLVAATLNNRFGARNLVKAGFVVMSAGILGGALAPSLPLLFVAQFFIGLAMGVSYPVLMGLSIRNVDDAERTTAMGLHQAVYSVGMFAGPWLSGILADAIGLRPMLGVTAVGCLSLGLFLVRLVPRRR